MGCTQTRMGSSAIPRESIYRLGGILHLDGDDAYRKEASSPVGILKRYHDPAVGVSQSCGAGCLCVDRPVVVGLIQSSANFSRVIVVATRNQYFGFATATIRHQGTAGATRYDPVWSSIRRDLIRGHCV